MEELSLWSFYYFYRFLICIFMFLIVLLMIFTLSLPFGFWSYFYQHFFLDSTSFCCIFSFYLAITYCLLSINLFLEVLWGFVVVISTLWSSFIDAIALTNLGLCCNYISNVFFIFQLLCIHIGQFPLLHVTIFFCCF